MQARSGGQSKDQTMLPKSFQDVLLEILLKELRHRYKFEQDAWNNHYWFSRRLYGFLGGRTNPFPQKLEDFNTAYPQLVVTSGKSLVTVRAECIVGNATLLATLRSTEKLDTSLNTSFSDSVSTVCKLAGILPKKADETNEQLYEAISDPILKRYYDDLALEAEIKKDKDVAVKTRRLDIEVRESVLGFGKIPGYFSMPLEQKKHFAPLYLLATHPALDFSPQNPQDFDQSISRLTDLSRDTLVAKRGGGKDLLALEVRAQIVDLYRPIQPPKKIILDTGAARSQATCLAFVKEKVPSFWNWMGFESSEQKTVRLLLEESQKENPDREAVERRLRRLEMWHPQLVAVSLSDDVTSPLLVGLQVSKDSKASPTQVIRDVFAEAENDVAIKAVSRFESEIVSELSDLKKRRQQLEHYEEVIAARSDTDVSFSGITLPGNIQDVQALAYFIFQHNASDFPIAWTPDNRLSITREGNYAHLLSSNVLDTALFTQSRSLYFTVLMVSIALTNANDAEYSSLQKLLQGLLNGIANGDSIPRNEVVKRLPNNLVWLQNYIPSEITPPDNHEIGMTIVAKVKTALEEMFPPRIMAATPDVKAVLENQSFDTQTIDFMSSLDLGGLVVSYAKRIEGGRELSSEEFAVLKKSFNRIIKEKGASSSNQSILLAVLLDWYAVTHGGSETKGGMSATIKGREFIERCFDCSQSIFDPSKQSNGMFKISLTNRKILPREPADASAFKSREWDQNIYHSGALRRYKESSADRLIDIVYSLFPERVVSIGRKIPALSREEKNYLREVSASAANIKGEPSISDRIKDNLEKNRTANRKVLAAYTLCQWYKSTDGGKINFNGKYKGRDEFIKAYEKIEKRLSAAMTGNEPDFPAVKIQELINDLRMNFPNLLWSGALKRSPSSLAKLLDHLEVIARPGSALYPEQVRVVAQAMPPNDDLTEETAPNPVIEAAVSSARARSDSEETEEYKAGDEPEAKIPPLLVAAARDPIIEDVVPSTRAVDLRQKTVDERPWWERAVWAQELEKVLMKLFGMTAVSVKNDVFATLTTLQGPADSSSQYRKSIALYCLAQSFLVTHKVLVMRDDSLVEHVDQFHAYLGNPMKHDMPVSILSFAPFARLRDEEFLALKNVDFSSLDDSLVQKIKAAKNDTRFTIEEMERIYTLQDMQEHYSAEKPVYNTLSQSNGVCVVRNAWSWLVDNYETYGLFARAVINFQMGCASEDDRMSENQTQWLTVPSMPLSQLLNLYADAVKDSLEQKEYKMRIDAVCGPGVRKTLKAALLKFHASQWRNGGDTTLASDGHKLPTQMEAIVTKLNNSLIPLAQILLDLRAAAHERRDATCSSRFFVARLPETRQGYACIDDYLFNVNGKKIEKPEDFQRFIDELNPIVPVATTSPAVA